MSRTSIPSPILEVCCGDLESVVAAKAGGAQRIELCSALSEGGLTPSAGLIAEALRQGIAKVHVLIRPRNGDFLYTESEVAVMEHDIRAAVAAGADGVVIGALTEDGEIDIPTCRRLVKAAGSASVTFHRAFDLCRNPEKALEEIITLGCDRILTSGLAQSALAGAERLASLNRLVAGRIILLAGGGVNPENAREIMNLTGLNELHASAKTTTGSRMKFRREAVNMGEAGKDEYSRQVTDASTVAEIIHAMNTIQ